MSCPQDQFLQPLVGSGEIVDLQTFICAEEICLCAGTGDRGPFGARSRSPTYTMRSRKGISVQEEDQRMVSCPHCASVNVITLDRLAGGSTLDCLACGEFMGRWAGNRSELMPDADIDAATYDRTRR